MAALSSKKAAKYMRKVLESNLAPGETVESIDFGYQQELEELTDRSRKAIGKAYLTGGLAGVAGGGSGASTSATRAYASAMGDIVQLAVVLTDRNLWIVPVVQKSSAMGLKFEQRSDAPTIVMPRDRVSVQVGEVQTERLLGIKQNVVRVTFSPDDIEALTLSMSDVKLWQEYSQRKL